MVIWYYGNKYFWIVLEIQYIMLKYNNLIIIINARDFSEVWDIFKIKSYISQKHFFTNNICIAVYNDFLSNNAKSYGP